MRARMYIRTPPDMEQPEAQAAAEKITNSRHGAENVQPVSSLRNDVQEAWHRVLHIAGIHWYVYTEIYDLETGEIEPVGSVCWLCPETLAALRRR